MGFNNKKQGIFIDERRIVWIEYSGHEKYVNKICEKQFYN